MDLSDRFVYTHVHTSSIDDGTIVRRLLCTAARIIILLCRNMCPHIRRRRSFFAHFSSRPISSSRVYTVLPACPFWHHWCIRLHIAMYSPFVTEYYASRDHAYSIGIRNDRYSSLDITGVLSLRAVHRVRELTPIMLANGELENRSADSRI